MQRAAFSASRQLLILKRNYKRRKRSLLGFQDGFDFILHTLNVLLMECAVLRREALRWQYVAYSVRRRNWRTDERRSNSKDKLADKERPVHACNLRVFYPLAKCTRKPVDSLETDWKETANEKRKDKWSWVYYSCSPTVLFIKYNDMQSKIYPLTSSLRNYKVCQLFPNRVSTSSRSDPNELSKEFLKRFRGGAIGIALKWVSSRLTH